MDAHPMERRAKQAWVTWAQGTARWQWFVTLTFARDVSEQAALRALKRWARDLAAQPLAGGHYGLGYVMDRQPISGRWHFHVLCSFGGIDVDPGWAQYLWGALASRFPTGHADAKRYDGSDAGLHYAFRHDGERGLGVVCPRDAEPCKHRNCTFGTSPWPKVG